VPCGEFEIVRRGPKVIFSVNGTGKYGMQDMLFVVLNISKKFDTDNIYCILRTALSSKLNR